MVTLRNPSPHDMIVIKIVGRALSMSTGTTGVILTLIMSKIGSHVTTGRTKI